MTEWNYYNIGDKKIDVGEGYNGAVWVRADWKTQIGTYRVISACNFEESHGLMFEPRKGKQHAEPLWVQTFKPNKKPLNDFIDNAIIKAGEHFSSEVM